MRCGLCEPTHARCELTVTTVAGGGGSGLGREWPADVNG